MERNALVIMKSFLLHPVVSVILKTIIAIGLIAALLHYIDIRAILISLSNANYMYIIAGSVFMFANIALQYYRWKFLVRLVSKDIPTKEIFASLLIGYSAGFFTPGQIGEFGGRVISLNSIRKAHILAMSMIDKLYILALTIIFGCISFIIFFHTHLSDLWRTQYTFLSIFLASATAFVFLFPSQTKKLLLFLPEKIRSHRIYVLIEVIEKEFHNREGRILFLLTVLLFCIIIIQYHLFLNAFEPVGFGVSSIGTLIILFVKSVVLPISIGDLGVRESTAVFFFSQYGVSPAAAFNMSLFIFFTNIFLPSLAGALYILRLKFSSNKNSTT